jgi:L-fuconolactonase
MNRRQFVLAAGGAALPAPTRIIDTHTHFYDPSRPQGVPWPSPKETQLYRTVLPRHFKQIAQPLGVTGTVVVEASPWVEDNQWVLDLAKDDPFLVGLVGHLEPGEPEFKTHLERFRKNRLFLGIRVGPAKLEKGAEDFARLSDAGLELDILGPASMFPAVVRFADRFPRLRIVLNHLPQDFPAEAAPLRAALRELASRPQVFAKVSGVLRTVNGRTSTRVDDYREPLDELWSLFGPDRVIYGSDWPVSERRAPYAGVLKVVMDYFTAKGEDAAEKYFWKNSRAAYRW